MTPGRLPAKRGVGGVKRTWQRGETDLWVVVEYGRTVLVGSGVANPTDVLRLRPEHARELAYLLLLAVEGGPDGYEDPEEFARFRDVVRDVVHRFFGDVAEGHR